MFGEIILKIAVIDVLHFEDGRVTGNYALDEVGEEKLLEFFTGSRSGGNSEIKELCV